MCISRCSMSAATHLPNTNDPDGMGLSSVAKSYIAGLLKYAPEYMLITNQYVNSYKRLVPGFDAPVLVSWGSRNRSAMVRVPRYKPSKPSSTRIAVRSVDSAANPYLAYAAMLGAGLKGIEEGLDLCAPVEENLFKLSQAEIAERGLKYLPRDLSQAIDEFEKSELMHEILGDVICENLHFGQTRRMGGISRTRELVGNRSLSGKAAGRRAMHSKTILVSCGRTITFSNVRPRYSLLWMPTCVR